MDGKSGSHVWEVCDDFADTGFLPCAYRERSRRCTYSSAVTGDLLLHATVLRVSCRKEFRPVDAYARHNCHVLADLMDAEFHEALARGLRQKFLVKNMVLTLHRALT